MCLSITTQAQVLKPNQKIIKKTFTEFKILNSGCDEFEEIGEDYNISFKFISPLSYEFNCNGNTDFMYYTLVLDNILETTNFINEYNIFTWYKEDGEIYLKQKVLVGELKETVIIFK